MNKTKLKNYAPKARQTFLRIVRERADLLGLTKKEIDTPRVEGDVAIIEGNPYPKRFANLHQNLKKAIEAEGLEAFIERVAYSWFNRFAAIRFMEVNGFLSHSYRVLSNRDISKNEPEILEHAADVELAGLDKAEIVEFKLAGNKDAELYKLLLIAQCNELHSAMPFLFERVNDETELLLPDNLLHTDSVIRKMTSEIAEEDWHNVEIIGWLYQFYISEKKDEVIGKTVKSADIPAATQLFTPNWIVKYMTQNSLGRLWLEVNPTSQLAQNMEFYISQGTSEQGRGTSEETETLVPRPSSLVPEEIRILDPACGSGHILVEAYDLMKAIYTERGYSSREIPLLILENNLFGLDIDKRAVQLASFALLMKARFDDRRIFEKFKIQNSNFKIPQIYEIPELPADNPEYEPKGIAEMFFSDGANRGAVPIRDEKYMFSEMNPQPSLVQSPESNVQSLKNNEQRTTNNEQITEQNIIDLLELFENGKTYGSLIRIPHGFGAVVARIARRVQTKAVSGDMNEQIAARQLIPFVQAAQILALKYDAVIANPPYMGGKGMNAALKDFAKREFPESKSDLFAMFIERNLELTKETGKLGFMTPFVWMFISSYEKLLDILINDATITTLVQLEYSGFAEATVPICTFTLAKKHDKNAVSSFIRLSDFKGHQNQAPKTLEAIQNTDCSWFYSAKPDNFKKIQGSPIAYWASDKMQNIYESHSSIGDFYSPKQGLSTADNNRFLRLWFEIAQVKSGFSISNLDEALQSKKKWFPLDKGGDYRKWYGNNEYVINWENNGYELRSLQPKSVIRSPNSYFKSGVTWGKITSGAFSTRATAEGFIFSDAGMKIPCEQTTDVHLLSGFLNSKLASHFLSALSETLNFEQGSISLLPLKKTNNFQVSLVEKMIEIARADWDSFETSWDFERFPILDFGFWIERNGKAPNSVE
ncbi:MAG: BREX-1 system adenine-specific DNA-methyltransferase PglX, partial [Aridibacter sp.]